MCNTCNYNKYISICWLKKVGGYVEFHLLIWCNIPYLKILKLSLINLGGMCLSIAEELEKLNHNYILFEQPEENVQTVHWVFDVDLLWSALLCKWWLWSDHRRILLLQGKLFIEYLPRYLQLSLQLPRSVTKFPWICFYTNIVYRILLYIVSKYWIYNIKYLF